MGEVLWEKEVARVRREKELRHLVRRFLRERLRGLPPGFRLEVEVRSLRPRRVLLRIPAHSEGSPIRIVQVDLALEELASLGVEAEPVYLDDALEAELCRG